MSSLDYTSQELSSVPEVALCGTVKDATKPVLGVEGRIRTLARHARIRLAPTHSSQLLGLLSIEVAAPVLPTDRENQRFVFDLRYGSRYAVQFKTCLLYRLQIEIAFKGFRPPTRVRAWNPHD